MNVWSAHTSGVFKARYCEKKIEETTNPGSGPIIRRSMRGVSPAFLKSLLFTLLTG